MPALKAAGPMFSVPRIDPVPPSATWKDHTARCVTRWGRSGSVISVYGELDVSNAGRLADYVQHCARYCDWLVLDLSDLEFVGTAGFSALTTIAGHCADTSVRCAMVPGIAAARMLRICDPAGVLPTAMSVAGALAGVQRLRPVI